MGCLPHIILLLINNNQNYHLTFRHLKQSGLSTPTSWPLFPSALFCKEVGQVCTGDSQNVKDKKVKKNKQMINIVGQVCTSKKSKKMADEGKNIAWIANALQFTLWLILIMIFWCIVRTHRPRRRSQWSMFLDKGSRPPTASRYFYIFDHILMYPHLSHYISMCSVKF